MSLEVIHIVQKNSDAEKCHFLNIKFALFKISVPDSLRVKNDKKSYDKNNENVPASENEVHGKNKELGSVIGGVLEEFGPGGARVGAAQTGESAGD